MSLRQRVHLWKGRCGLSDCDINMPGTKENAFRKFHKEGGRSRKLWHENPLRALYTKVGEGAQVLLALSSVTLKI
jgi:hypothetical protein